MSNVLLRQKRSTASQDSQEVEGSDSSLAFGTREITPGVLRPLLGFPVHERH